MKLSSLRILACGLALSPLFACTPADDPSNTLELPGIETSSLTPRERRELKKYVDALIAPCADVAVPVGQCLTEKRACSKCLPAIKQLYKDVREGHSPKQIEGDYKRRFDPSAVQTIDVKGAPALGPEDARVVIVEFADFECPFCKRMVPTIDKALADHPKDVRVYFKFYPIRQHAHADASAHAAAAALLQGKFWEMHHALFDHQANLEDRDIDAYAAQLGLDMARFTADSKSTEVAQRVERDASQGNQLKVAYTPYVFVNGRVFDPAHDNLEEWIEGELDPK
jgi:protein-disulfide isomerase